MNLLAGIRALVCDDQSFIWPVIYVEVRSMRINKQSSGKRLAASRPAMAFVPQCIPQCVDEAKNRIPESGPTAARIALVNEQGQLEPMCHVDVESYDERGLSFHHSLPLSARRALVFLEGTSKETRVAEIDLCWCRFNRKGHYTSGGRFVRPAGKTA